MIWWSFFMRKKWKNNTFRGLYIIKNNISTNYGKTKQSCFDR